MRYRARIFAVAIAASAAAFQLAASGASAAQSLQISTQPVLFPAFDPGISNYVTRCANDPVSVSVTAPNGTTVDVDGQGPRSGSFTTSVGLSEGQEFLIDAKGSTTSTYHVRCLPSDFPTFTAHRSGTPQAAYFIVTPSLTPPDMNQTVRTFPWVAIFDANGVPRWFVKSPPAPLDAKQLPTGDISWYQFATGAPATSEALDGTPGKTYNAGSNDPVDDHELQVLPNGNYFLAVERQINNVDLSPCGGPKSGSIADPIIEEVDSKGNTIWSWDTYDHIPLSEVAPEWRTDQCGDPTGDPYHFNAIEPHGSDVLISYRHLDAVYNVNTTSSSSSIVWKLGGTQTAQSLSVANDPVFSNGGTFGGQHDVRELSDGTVTLHDNGTRSQPQRGPRAVRYRIDTSNNTATLIDTVSDPSSSFCCGSARKLGAGDWVTAWGGTPYVEELTTSGTIVFSLKFDNSVFSYRAVPITDTSYGASLDQGMDAQHPRTAGGPTATVPEAPVALGLPLVAAAMIGGATLVRRRRALRR